MKKTHAMLASIVVAGVLCGCGSGTATTGTGTAFAANPQLRAADSWQPTPGSGTDVARAIAAHWATAETPAPSFNAPIESRTIDFTATVYDPGATNAFTGFITTRRTTLVTPASAATIDASNGAPSRFATPADQALWRAQGRPSLGQVPAAGQTQTIPVGEYSFIPQGSTLTYRQAAALPASPGQLGTAILDHLRPYSGPHPPASLELTQLAYLIATAPLTDETRSAAWRVVASLPGLRTCQARSSRPGSRVVGLCIDSADDETIVSVAAGTGAIVAVADRLMRSSPMYPHVRVGTVIESSTFLAA
jgi:hypothetical protein